MGNTACVPTGLSPEEAAVVRGNFRDRVAKSVFVENTAATDNGMCIVVKVSEEAAKKCVEGVLWGYDPARRPDPKAHILVVTHALSWLHGTEMTARLPAGSSKETIDNLCCTLSGFVTMQTGKGKEDLGPKFQFFESSESMVWSWDAKESGDKGGLLLPEPVLRGGKWRQEYASVPWTDEEGDIDLKELMEEESANSAPHDEDYWPRHFVTVTMMHPCEYAKSTSLAPRVIGNLFALHMGTSLFVTDKSRPCLVHNAAFRADLKAISNSMPTHAAADGMTLDIRLRKGNRALDVVVSPRCMAHLLIPMEACFGKKPSVPKGSFVRGESDGHQCDIMFSSHHPDSGEPIQDGQGFWVVNYLHYGTGPETLVKVPMELSKALSEVPQGPLWEELDLMRMVMVTVYMPAAVMAGMLSDVRRGVEAKPRRNWDKDPMLLEWPEAFSGCQPSRYSHSCFTNKKPEDGDETQTTTAAIDNKSNITSPVPLSDDFIVVGDGSPLVFRFGGIGMGYFDDETTIDDSGAFIPMEDYELPPDLPPIPTDLEEL